MFSLEAKMLTETGGNGTQQKSPRRLVLPVIRKERVKLIPVIRNAEQKQGLWKPKTENLNVFNSSYEQEIHSELAFCLSHVIFMKLMSPPKYKII